MKVDHAFFSITNLAVQPREREADSQRGVEGERGEIAPVPPVLDERDRPVLPVVAQQHYEKYKRKDVMKRFIQFF